MKKIYSTILVGNLLLVLSFFSCQAPEMRVFDLRTDYLTNPVAIQANFIWLGWKLDVCNGKNRNKKLLVMYIDFFLMTLFGGIYNIYTSKNYYIYLYK